MEFLQFVFRWINCLLSREIPFAQVQRLWDTYLSEGKCNIIPLSFFFHLSFRFRPKRAYVSLFVCLSTIPYGCMADCLGVEAHVGLPVELSVYRSLSAFLYYFLLFVSVSSFPSFSRTFCLSFFLFSFFLSPFLFLSFSLPFYFYFLLSPSSSVPNGHNILFCRFTCVSDSSCCQRFHSCLF